MRAQKSALFVILIAGFLTSNSKAMAPAQPTATTTSMTTSSTTVVQSFATSVDGLTTYTAAAIAEKQYDEERRIIETE